MNLDGNDEYHNFDTKGGNEDQIHENNKFGDNTNNGRSRSSVANNLEVMFQPP